MVITLEFLNEQKVNLENERSKALNFIATADGALAMIAVLVTQLEKSEEEVLNEN